MPWFGISMLHRATDCCFRAAGVIGEISRPILNPESGLDCGASSEWRLENPLERRCAGTRHRCPRGNPDEMHYIPAEVPGEIHLDVWKAGLIVDPYLGENVLSAHSAVMFGNAGLTQESE